jgi:hypothetical protein
MVNTQDRPLSARTGMAHRLVRAVVRVIILACLGVLVATPTTSDARVTGRLSARPASIDFGHKRVGTTYYKQTRITNRFAAPIRVLVDGGLPDDFGFGLLPGSTCPVLNGGDVMQPGQSCIAVVRFTPSDRFIGWHAVGSLQALAFDPTSGAELARLPIPVTGTAVAPHPYC